MQAPASLQVRRSAKTHIMHCAEQISWHELHWLAQSCTSIAHEARRIRHPAKHAVTSCLFVRKAYILCMSDATKGFQLRMLESLLNAAWQFGFKGLSEVAKSPSDSYKLSDMYHSWKCEAPGSPKSTSSNLLYFLLTLALTWLVPH